MPVSAALPKRKRITPAPNGAHLNRREVAAHLPTSAPECPGPRRWRSPSSSGGYFFDGGVVSCTNMIGRDDATSAKGELLSVSRREADLAAFIDLTRSLASRDDIFEILFSVVSRLADMLGVDRGSIVLKQASDDEATATDRALGIVVASSDDAMMRNHTFSLDKYPEIQKVLDTGEVLVIRDVAESPLLTDVLKAEGSLAFSSMALLPIVVENSPIAVLCLKRGARADFTEDDIMHAQAVANATAIALDNARVLRELRDEARALFSAHTRDEQKLKELSRYLDIFESSRDAMMVMDENGKVLFANPMAAHLAHRELSDLVGTSFEGLVASCDTAAVREVLLGFSRGQYPAGLDFHLQPIESEPALSTTTVCVNFSAMPGKNRAVLATLRDVTSERGMARELSRTKDFLERVIESSVDGIVSADLRGNVLVFNRSACRLFGYERDEVIGKLRVDQLYPAGVAKEIMRRIKSPDGGGVGRLTEDRVEMLTREGACIPVNLTASLVMNGERPVGTVGIFTDIRNRLAMEARLAEAQRQLQDRQRQDAIAEVAGAAAHELNQPLTSVMGYAEYLKRAVSSDPTLAHAVEVIMSETQRMAEIVRKVGKITRYETKPYVGATKIVDLDRSSTPDR